MATQNFRVGFSGWPNGVLEEAAGDGTRLDRQSLARAYNIRLDEVGAIRLRGGITARTTGLPATDYTVEEFKNASIHALVACDGKTVRVLENTGWTSVGTFTTDGGRASMAMLNQRMYIANGVDKIKVLDYIAPNWNLRDAGVIAPTVAPSVSFTGTGTAIDSWVFAYSYVDNRGFESNISPITIVENVFATSPSFQVTVTAGGASISAINLYASLRNQRTTYFYQAVANSAGPHTVDGNNLSRDESIEGPSKNTPPPAGIYSLIAHKNRLYGAGIGSFPSWYGFTRIGEAEYWPASFQQDLSVLKDPSDVVNFGVCSLGLLIGKETSALLLEGDPESTSAPQPVVQGAGLVHPDGIVSLNGVDFYVSQRGIMAHDGVRPSELWRRLPTSSQLAIQADRVTTAYSDTRAQFFFKDPSDATYVRGVEFDVDKRRFLVDKISLGTSTADVSDADLDFASDADVSLHENVENGAQEIASGGGDPSKVITLTTPSGPNSAKLVKGVRIKFVGDATIYNVTDVTGANITLDDVAPADGTAVEWMRGTVVDDGELKLASAATGPPGEVQYAATGVVFNNVSTVTLGTVPTPGNVLLAAINYSSSETTSVFPLDAGWTEVVSETGTDITTKIYTKTVSGDGVSSNWRMPFASNFGIMVHEFSGISDNVNASGTSSGLSIILSSPSIVVPSQNAFVYSNFFSSAGYGSGPTDGFNLIGNYSTAGAKGFGTSLVSTSPGTKSTTLTVSGLTYYVNITLSFDVVSGHALSTSYYSETVAKTSFPPSISAFGTQPVAVTANEPAGTSIRFGLRFANAGPVKTWTGSDWQDIGADPMVSGLTATAVNSLTAQNMIASGGFSLSVPYIQLVAYLRTTDANLTPSLDQVTYNYKTGNVSTFAYSLRLADSVPVAGGTDLPPGTYVWDTSNGYRLEDGTADNGSTITAEILTQKASSGKAQKTWWRRIVVEAEASVASTMTITPVIDGVEQTAITVDLNTYRDTYDVGIPNQASGVTCQAKITWTEPSIRIYQIHAEGETSGESMP